jgi:hypothetical protein
LCIAVMINPKCILGDFVISVVIHVQYLTEWLKLLKQPWNNFSWVHWLFNCHELTSLGSTICSAAMNWLLWGPLSVQLLWTNFCGVHCPGTMKFLPWGLLSVQLPCTDFCWVCCVSMPWTYFLGFTVCQAFMNSFLWGALSVRLPLTDFFGVRCLAAINCLPWGPHALICVVTFPPPPITKLTFIDLRIQYFLNSSSVTVRTFPLSVSFHWPSTLIHVIIDAVES